MAGVVSGRVAVRVGRRGAVAGTAAADSALTPLFPPFVAARAAVLAGALFVRAALLAAVGAGLPSLLGPPAAALAFVAFLTLLVAPGAGLLTVIRPAPALVYKVTAILLAVNQTCRVPNKLY